MIENTAIPMIIFCPKCNNRHIDKGEFITKLHHTHACQSCGFVWRPAIVHTVGVEFLPGFKEPDEIDMEGRIDDKNNVQYIGKGIKQPNGKYHCLANVSGALCIVECTVSLVSKIDACTEQFYEKA